MPRIIPLCKFPVSLIDLSKDVKPAETDVCRFKPVGEICRNSDLATLGDPATLGEASALVLGRTGVGTSSVGDGM